MAARALFCSVCGAVQGPGDIDHFTRLGLGPGYDVDLDALDRQYFGFQRRLHPDRFAAKSSREKAFSQQQATALNDAYETLKDPLKRAAYLLRLAGKPVDLNSSATISDPVLLMEQMEKREAIAEAADVAEIGALIAEAEAEVAGCQKDLSAAFAANRQGEAAQLAVRLKYLLKLVEDARSRKVRMAGR